MKKVLIAVDDTKGTQNAFSMYASSCKCMSPDKVVLVYVEKLEGRSFLDDMVRSDAEMKTLKEALEGTEYQNALDKKARAVLGYYKKELENSGLTDIKTVIRKGHPAEEILAVAKEESADMIIIGSRSRSSRVSHLLMGSVSREVVNTSEIPVLVVK